MEKQVCIIGAGPAGLISAIFSASSGAGTIVLETNSNPGRKLLLTGGRRCNITHDIESAELVRLLGKQGRFLSYCLYEYPPKYILDFFSDMGLETKTETDGCVFPVSYKAEDVKKVLVEKAKNLEVEFSCNRRVINIIKKSGAFIVETKDHRIHAEKIIIATGGISYPQTGSTGDGYRFAQQLGHTIIEPRPSLVPLVTSEKWPGLLAGTSANVGISTTLNNKPIVTQGAVVFTNNGLGGPAAQDMSRHLTDYLPASEPVGITLDLAPDFEHEHLEARIVELTNENPKKKLVNVLADFLPRRLAVVVCEFAGCDDETPAGQLKKQTRHKITQTIKALPLSVVRTRSIEEATVTRGGVSFNEINPKTMESKICPGLFFAGEVIDVDGPCGGYNLQICWSTGALAGACAAK